MSFTLQDIKSSMIQIKRREELFKKRNNFTFQALFCFLY